MSDFTICTNHNQALKLLNKLSSKLSNVNENEKLLDIVNEIIDNIIEAKRSGKRMESRLYDYKDSIEKLGFKRVRKKGK